MNAKISSLIDNRIESMFRSIPQEGRCNRCRYNVKGLCIASPTNDSIEDYLSECDHSSNCGRNMNK